MKIINIIKENALRFTFLILFSTAESYYFLSTVFAINNAFILSFLATLAIVSLGVIIASLPRIFSASLFSLIAVALVYLIIYFGEPLGNLIFLINTAIPNNEYIKLDETVHLLFIISFVFILINFVIIMLMNKSLLSMVLSIAFVSYFYFKYGYINMLFVVFYLSSVLLVFLTWIIPKADAEDDTGTKKFLVPLVLIISAAIILASLTVIRSNNNTAPLAWIDDLDWFEREKPVPKIVVMIDGQSQLTNLNDEFNYGSSKMMNVTSPYLEKLRSKTYDSYTNEGWEKTQEDTDSNIQMQYAQAELIQLLTDNNIDYTSYEMTVELFAQSQMIFAPLHAELATAFANEINVNPYGDIYTDVLLEQGTTYSLNAVHINYMSNEFINLIIHSQSDNVDNKKNYLAVPENIENSLKPLAEQLTKDAGSNYEKAKIIESYLSQNYTYNLKPPEKPANADFVEYFLFETGEGFCTHYASSMVLMLRSIDIPCRYVTGYVLSAPDDFESIPEIKAGDLMFIEGTPYEFNVQKQNSHAWVEVWFDDFGWLAFEPTSIYTSSFGFTTYVDLPEFTEIEETDQTEQEEPEKSSKIAFIVFSSVLLLALISIFSVRIYIAAHRSNKEKIYVIWKSIKKLYQKGRKTKKVNETAMEFVQRVDKDSIDLLETAKIFDIAMYSGRDITSEQVSETNSLYKSIRKIYEKQK